jgi:hypothetical protein
MMAVPGVLLIAAAAVVFIPGAFSGVQRAAARFTDHAAYGQWVLGGKHIRWPRVQISRIEALDVVYALIAVAGAFGAALLGLFGRPLRDALPSAIREPTRNVLHRVRDLHSGEIGDYVTWWTVGASLLGAVCLVALT